MGRSPDSLGGHVDFAWIGFGIGDELRDCFRRERRVEGHNKGSAANARDRRDVADEIEIQICIERGVDRGR